MLNCNRRDTPADAGKSGLKPALYDPPIAPARAASAGAPLRQQAQAAAATRELPPAAAPAPTEATAAAPARAAASSSGETAGSKLFIGVNIKLKGVEISDCDVLVIEVHVEATVHSKAMQIDKPGTLKGTALIDVAEIHGDFSGELTARGRLVVHGTGRVQGTIRYGKLVVAEGGELSGDIKCLDDTARRPKPLVGTVTEP